MNKILFSVAVLTSLFFSLQSQSLVEFSVGYQGIVSGGTGGNWLGPVNMAGAYGFTAEGRFEIPVTGIGIGLRYGKMGLSGSSSGASLTMDSTQLSALLAYRLINTGVLFGAVFTYGLSNSGSLQHSLATPATAVTASTNSSYTAGLEFGIKFPFLIALELGTASLKMSGFSTQTLSGNPTNVDMTGTYARLSTGFNF